MQDDWLSLQETDKEQSLCGWVQLHDLETSETKNTETSVSLEARRLLGGITYQVVEPVAIYSAPSRLQTEVSTLSPGESVTGFPANQHWIRLDTECTEPNFVSHWVFQHPVAPAMHATWCKLKILQKKSGILKVTWPGLKDLSSISPGFTLYSLEWNFPGGKGGCGLVPAPETLMHLKRALILSNY